MDAGWSQFAGRPSVKVVINMLAGEYRIAIRSLRRSLARSSFPTPPLSTRNAWMLSSMKS